MNHSDWLKRYEQRRAEERRQAKASLAAILPRLQALRVTRVVIRYDGYGDEGTVEAPAAFAGEADVELPKELVGVLSEAADFLLPDGWQNNAGAFGEFELDVPARKLVREHSWRVEEVCSDVEEHLL